MRPARDSRLCERRNYAIGARVVIRDEEWLVRGVRAAGEGASEVHVLGVSELVRDRHAVFLDDIDRIDELRAEDTALVADASPGSRRTRLHLEGLLRQTPPTDAALHVGHRGAMDRVEYQLEPAALALAQPRPRLLIADAVGLGKTIEVGVLLAELIRRGRGRRILVVALRSVLEQLQAELWARFTIALVRLDSLGLQRVQRSIPAAMNPFDRFERVILSIDTLKKDEKYRRYLEQCRWDVIVLDECQHVADRGASGRERSQRSRLAALLARTCDALILTSATPHDGRPESFASLIDLLDPAAVADPSHYTRDDLRGLYIRRFKKDVAHEARAAFPERSLAMHSIPASAEEDAVFDLLARAEFRTVDSGPDGRGVLLRTLLLKAFLSSPAALRASLAERRSHPHVLADTAAAAHDRDLLDRLDRLAAAVTPENFAKLQRLLALLRGLADGDRVLVFSERIDTLELLLAQLPSALGLPASAVCLFHGGLDDTGQQDLVKRFGAADAPLRLLLASDAASEGINLHYACHHLIHFDLPWSLITLEQRNGRIDRFGQTRPPRLDYLLTVPADPGLRGDLRVLARLIDKERAAHDSLGDVRWLMRLFDPDAEARRVAEGIAAGDAPEQIVPDAPPDSDPFTLPSPPRIAVTRAEPLSLFADERAFVRDGFAELHAVDPRISLPEETEDRGAILIRPPDDLARRLDLLPPEIRGHAPDLELSADRGAVQRAFARARERGDGWPERSLLWELHPVVEWLCDRLLGGLDRHTAPVMPVPQGLPGDAAAFVMQGTVTDRRSQPLVVDWFAVVFNNAHDDPTIVALRDILDRTCLLGHEISYQGETDRACPIVSAPKDMLDTSCPYRHDPRTSRPLDLAPLLELRARAVAAATSHMQRLGQRRLAELAPRLADEQQRLGRWAERVRQQLELERARAVRGDQRARLTRREHDLDALLAARQRWLADNLATAGAPHLRIAAVLVGPQDRSRGA